MDILSSEIAILEELLIKTFFKKEVRNRFIVLARSKKGRRKLQQTLSHFTNFENRYITRIPTNQQHNENIYQALVAKGAQTHCHILAESPALDQQILPLNTALNEIVGTGICALIGCIPGQLGYYEGEELSERVFLINQE